MPPPPPPSLPSPFFQFLMFVLFEDEIVIFNVRFYRLKMKLLVVFSKKIFQKFLKMLEFQNTESKIGSKNISQRNFGKRSVYF
jgi:hypothetical protein